MKHVLMGNNPLLGYLGLKLLELGKEVEWQESANFTESPRPLKLLKKDLQKISRQLAKAKTEIDFLLKAPAIDAHISPSQEELETHAWPQTAEQLMHHCCPRLLKTALKKAFREKGGLLTSKEFFIAPSAEERKNKLYVLDLKSSERKHWEQLHHYSTNEASRSFYQLQCSLENNVLLDSNTISHFQFDGVHAILESSQSKKIIYNIFSHSEYLAHEHFKSIKNMNQQKHHSLQALFAMNTNFVLYAEKIFHDLSHFYFPDVFLMGSSIGEFSPILNRKSLESFSQIEKLFKILKDSQTTKTHQLHWNERTRKTFIKKIKWEKRWERFLFSSKKNSWEAPWSFYGMLPSSLKKLVNAQL